MTMPEQEKEPKRRGEWCLLLWPPLLPCSMLSLFINCIWRHMKRKAFKCRKMKVSSVFWSKNLNNSIEPRHPVLLRRFTGSRTFANYSWVSIFTILIASNSWFWKESYDIVKRALQNHTDPFAFLQYCFTDFPQENKKADKTTERNLQSYKTHKKHRGLYSI